jgi:hypothetical protein
MALKGHVVTFRRQTREHDRDDGGQTQHYIVENTDLRAFVGYVTVRHVSAPAELSATVLLQETQSWDSPEARDVLRAIERYAFEAQDCRALSVELNGGDTTPVDQWTEHGYTPLKGTGRRVVVRKARDESLAP